MRSHHECSICGTEADWIRVRMPIARQMDYLCNRHYQSLRERNPIMAAWYDCLAQTAPMDIEAEATPEEASEQS